MIHNRTDGDYGEDDNNNNNNNNKTPNSFRSYGPVKPHAELLRQRSGLSQDFNLPNATQKYAKTPTSRVVFELTNSGLSGTTLLQLNLETNT
jgi:hypothetical protein